MDYVSCVGRTCWFVRRADHPYGGVLPAVCVCVCVVLCDLET